MTKKRRTTRAANLEAALREVVLAFRQARIPYMLIGALALPVWGRPRATLDIDFMILADEIPEKVSLRLSMLGFDRDSEWEKLNPFLKGVQARFRSKTLILDILFLGSAPRYYRRTELCYRSQPGITPCSGAEVKP